MDQCKRYNWVTDLKNILFKYGQELWDPVCFVKEYKKSQILCVISFYAEFKLLLDVEWYLIEITQSHLRTARARFRCCSCALAVEKGRHANINRYMRFCVCCQMLGKSVDEHHFLFKCSLYDDIRSSYLNDVINKNVMSVSRLMNTTSETTLYNLSKFIYHRFIRRHNFFSTW